MKIRNEGVQGLRSAKIDRSKLRKMKGRLWIGAERGFSLIELIGVLAIMGILASMTVPPILRQIRQAQTSNEDANLNEVARAIVEEIKATGTIPNPNVGALAAGGWATISLPYTALGTNQLLYVTGTSVDQQRRMYLSGGLTNYFSNNFINFGIPPFTTPASGWPTNAFPDDLQFVLVSSAREDLLLSCSASNNLASNGVVWLKNWVKQATNGIYFATNTAVVGSIANSTGTWTNKGEFLHVKVVDLRPLFCRVELIDTAAPVVVDMANPGSGYTGTPSPTNINGTTINYLTNGANTNVSILSFFPAQRQSGLTNRGTNTSLLTNRVLDPGGGPLLYATNRITTPGAPQFEINSLGATTIPNQQTNFYLIQGTTLRLISPTNATTNSSTIQKDCQFEYYGGNWRQLY